MCIRDRGNTILTFETPDQSVAHLAAVYIDLLLAVNSFITPVVEGSAGALVFVGPDVAIGGGVAMGMRKGESELAEKMGAALESMKADGTVDKLLMEYFKLEATYGN